MKNWRDSLLTICFAAMIVIGAIYLFSDSILQPGSLHLPDLKESSESMASNGLPDPTAPDFLGGKRSPPQAALASASQDTFMMAIGMKNKMSQGKTMTNLGSRSPSRNGLHDATAQNSADSISLDDGPPWDRGRRNGRFLDEWGYLNSCLLFVEGVLNWGDRKKDSLIASTHISTTTNAAGKTSKAKPDSVILRCLIVETQPSTQRAVKGKASLKPKEWLVSHEQNEAMAIGYLAKYTYYGEQVRCDTIDTLKIAKLDITLPATESFTLSVSAEFEGQFVLFSFGERGIIQSYKSEQCSALGPKQPPVSWPVPRKMLGRAATVLIVSYGEMNANEFHIHSTAPLP